MIGFIDNNAVLCAITRTAPLSRSLEILYRLFGVWLQCAIYEFDSKEAIVSIIQPIPPRWALLDIPFLESSHSRAMNLGILYRLLESPKQLVMYLYARFRLLSLNRPSALG